MFTLSVYHPKYITIFFTLPIFNSSSLEHYKDICHTVYIFIKMLFRFSKCMNVFNLSEEAVKRCKALISVSYDPSLFYFTHSLLPRERHREGEIWVFQGRASPTQKKLTNLSNRAWRGKKCLYLYKLASSIKGKVKKCQHSHGLSCGEMVAVYKNLNQMLLFFPSLSHIIQALWLHHHNVSHPIPCSCPLQTLHLPNTCQIISTLSVLMSWIHRKTRRPQAEM